MKVWELKEGKEYVEVGLGRRYCIMNSELKYLGKDGVVWYQSDKQFRELVEMELTEYTPPTDWSKVPVDTKILVRDRESQEWIKGYLALYTYNRVYTWNEGKTSFTALDYSDVISWNQAKLYKEE